MNLFKKVTAFVVIIGLILVNSIVNAAPLDNATAAVTLDGTGASETLTVTVTKDFSSDNVDSVEIRDNAGTIVYTGVAATANNNGSFTVVADFDVQLSSGTRYSLAFGTVAGDYGAAVLVINTDNNLVVTANVQPVLKFAMENTSRDFGTLTSGSLSSISTGLEIGTNAISGVSVSAKTVNGGLISSTAGHTINLTGNDALLSNEQYQFSSTKAAANVDVLGGSTITDFVAQKMDTTDETFTVYTADKAQNFDITSYDVSFTAEARIAESTPSASDYTDTIVFTVTANF